MASDAIGNVRFV